jgi:hypothetical protein
MEMPASVQPAVIGPSRSKNNAVSTTIPAALLSIALSLLCPHAGVGSTGLLTEIVVLTQEWMEG